MRRCVLVDIDHCLSNAFHRDPMLGSSTWDEYHTKSIDDQPIHDIVLIVNTLYNTGFHVIGLTARPGKWRQLTNDWLLKHGIQLTDIIMRPDAEFRKSSELKVHLACEFFGSEEKVKETVAFILDDREDVCQAFKALGVTALQVYGREKE